MASKKYAALLLYSPAQLKYFCQMLAYQFSIAVLFKSSRWSEPSDFHPLLNEIPFHVKPSIAASTLYVHEWIMIFNPFTWTSCYYASFKNVNGLILLIFSARKEIPHITPIWWADFITFGWCYTAGININFKKQISGFSCCLIFWKPNIFGTCQELPRVSQKSKS